MTSTRTVPAQSVADMSVPEQLMLWLKVNMIDIAGAFAVLVIGLIVAGLVSRWVERALARSPRFEPTVANFLSNLVKYALWALVLVTVLSQFGVETTSILAALGGMALAVGLALQGTLSNVASGVMILVQKPFKVGEAISAGALAHCTFLALYKNQIDDVGAMALGATGVRPFSRLGSDTRPTCHNWATIRPPARCTASVTCFQPLTCSSVHRPGTF